MGRLSSLLLILILLLGQRPGSLCAQTPDLTAPRITAEPATAGGSVAPGPGLRPTGPGDYRWRDGFGATGTDGVVRAIAVGPNGDVFVAGAFTTAGGLPAANIARWDGAAWSTLGAGVNNDVYALAFVGNDLYVGGRFTTAGGQPASYIARWDGATWTALGVGTNQVVFCLATTGIDLYVGGGFTQAGGQPANYIARWDGAVWAPLGQGVNGRVDALAVSGPNLFVSGSFTLAGTAPAARLARWDGTSWAALGTGITGYIGCLAVSGGICTPAAIFPPSGQPRDTTSPA